MFAQHLGHKSNMCRHNPRNPVSPGACAPVPSLHAHPSCHLFSAILTHGLKLAQECLPVLKSYIHFPVQKWPCFVSTVPPGPSYASSLTQRCRLLLYKPKAVAAAVSTVSSCREDHNSPKQAPTVTLQFKLPLLSYLCCQLPWQVRAVCNLIFDFAVCRSWFLPT